ncbi:UNVERIFIED_CONTAM: hypothetical protein Sradi_3675100 [Sesamum radiatum]|uniref:Uncharacterized protein n=1 Tax=Sesamum radiatum TaxID=300843 RepID=A0AAW2QIY2_SESRA
MQVDAKVCDLQQKLKESEDHEKELTDLKVALETKVSDLELRLQQSAAEMERASRTAPEKGKDGDFPVGHEAGEAGKAEGITTGREVYLQSEEH